MKKHYRLLLVTSKLAGNIPDKVPGIVKTALAFSNWNPCLWAFDALPNDNRVQILYGVCSYLSFFKATPEAGE